MDRVALLASIPLFEGLADDDLRALAADTVERRFKAGQIIFNQGDESNAMYVIAEGHVNVHLPGEASRRLSLKDIARGEFFGELGLFDGKPRSASVLATTDVILLELSHETLSDYIERRPRAALHILKMMAARLRETNTLLSERVAKNVFEELDKQLTWRDRLADKVATLNGSWAFIVGLIVLTGAWTLFNAMSALKAFDPYPYVFYNLVLAILVALQGPLIMMSQNRQARKDRASTESDFRVNLKNEVNIETILRELGEFRAETNTRLENLEHPSSRSRARL
jgi:uncharacterized membrane protein